MGTQALVNNRNNVCAGLSPGAQARVAAQVASTVAGSWQGYFESACCIVARNNPNSVRRPRRCVHCPAGGHMDMSWPMTRPAEQKAPTSKRVAGSLLEGSAPKPQPWTGTITTTCAGPVKVRCLEARSPTRMRAVTVNLMRHASVPGGQLQPEAFSTRLHDNRNHGRNTTYTHQTCAGQGWSRCVASKTGGWRKPCPHTHTSFRLLAKLMTQHKMH